MSISRGKYHSRKGRGRIYHHVCMLRFQSDLGTLAFNQVPSGKMSSSILRLVGWCRLVWSEERPMTYFIQGTAILYPNQRKRNNWFNSSTTPNLLFQSILVLSLTPCITLHYVLLKFWYWVVVVSYSFTKTFDFSLIMYLSVSLRHIRLWE